MYTLKVEHLFVKITQELVILMMRIETLFMLNNLMHHGLLTKQHVYGNHLLHIQAQPLMEILLNLMEFRGMKQIKDGWQQMEKILQVIFVGILLLQRGYLYNK